MLMGQVGNGVNELGGNFNVTQMLGIASQVLAALDQRRN